MVNNCNMTRIVTCKPPNKRDSYPGYGQSL